MEKTIVFKDGSKTTISPEEITPAIEDFLRSKGFSNNYIASLKTPFPSKPAPVRGKAAGPDAPTWYDNLKSNISDASKITPGMQPQQISADTLRPPMPAPSWQKPAPSQYNRPAGPSILEAPDIPSSQPQQINASTLRPPSITGAASDWYNKNVAPAFPVVVDAYSTFLNDVAAGNKANPVYQKVAGAMSSAGQAIEDLSTKNKFSKLQSRSVGAVLSKVLPYSEDEITNYIDDAKQKAFAMLDPLRLPTMGKDVYEQPGTVAGGVVKQLGTEQGWKEHTVENLIMAAPLFFRAALKLNERGEIGGHAPPTGNKLPHEMTREEWSKTYPNESEKLVDIGDRIAAKANSREPEKILDYYKNKYNIGLPVEIGKPLDSTSKNIGETHFYKDTSGKTAKAVIHTQDTPAGLGALREEIEHVKDRSEGFTGSKPVLAGIKSTTEIIGHTKNHNYFTDEYLHRTLVMDAAKKGEYIPPKIVAQYPAELKGYKPPPEYTLPPPSERIPKSPPIPPMEGSPATKAETPSILMPTGRKSFVGGVVRAVKDVPAGMGEFASKDVWGTMKEAGTQLKESVKSVTGLFDPGGTSVKERSFELEKRGVVADSNIQMFQFFKLLGGKVRNAFEAFSPEQIDEFEKTYVAGGKQANPHVQGLSDAMHTAYKMQRDQVATLEPERVVDWTEDHLGHIYKGSEKTKGQFIKWYANRGGLGSTPGSFMHQKYFTAAEGEATITRWELEHNMKPGQSGLKLVSRNPVDIFMLNARSVLNWAEGKQYKAILDKLSATQELRTKPGQLVDDLPSGFIDVFGQKWKALNPRIFKVMEKQAVKTAQVLGDNEAAQKLAQKQGSAVDNGIMPEGYIDKNGKFVEGKKQSEFAPKKKAPVYERTENDYSKKYTPEEQALVDNEQRLKFGTNREMPADMRRTGVKRDSAAATGRADYRAAIAGGYSESEAAAMGTAAYRAWVPEDYTTAAGDVTRTNKKPYTTGRVVDGHLVADVPDRGPVGSEIPTKSDATPLADQWVQVGKTYAPEGIADIINRADAPGLGHNVVWEAFKNVNNKARQFALTGGFHIGAESYQSWMSTTTAMLRKLISTSPDLKGAGKDLLQLVVAPAANTVTGNRLYKLFVSGEEPANFMDKATLQMTKDGGIKLYDYSWHNNATQGLMSQLMRHPGNIPAVAWKGLWAAVEQITSVTMEHFVPRAKLGASYEFYRTELDKLPISVREQIKTALKDGTTDKLPRDVRDKYLKVCADGVGVIEGRMGQVNWSNLNLPKGLTEILQNLFLAPMWSGGFIREYIGGAKDLFYSLPKDLYNYTFERTKTSTELPPLKGQPVSHITEHTNKLGLRTTASRAAMIDTPRITNRTLYAIGGSIIVQAIISEIRQRLAGQGNIWDHGTLVKDFLHPRTGKFDKFGVAQRTTSPTQFKESGLVTEPITWAKNKLSPGAKYIPTIMGNKDYQNTQIANPKDRLLIRMRDKATFTLNPVTGYFGNFTAKNIMEGMKRGDSGWSIFDKAVGTTPTKRSEENDSFYNALSDAIGEKLGKASPTTKADAEHRTLMNDLANGLRNKTAYFEDVQKAMDERKLSKKDAIKIFDMAEEDPMKKAIDTIGIEQVKDVWNAADKQQKGMVFWYLLPKYKRLSSADDRIGKDYEQYIDDVIKMGIEIGVSPEDTITYLEN